MQSLEDGDIVTHALARSPAQVKSGRTGTDHGNFLAVFLSRSSRFDAVLTWPSQQRNAPALPMETDSPLMPRIHLPSHWLSCGQTRPQIAGSALDIGNDAVYASSKLPSFTSWMKSGIWMDYRAALYAFCILAAQAAAGLFHCFLLVVTKTYLVKICCSIPSDPVLLQELSLIRLPLLVTSAISASTVMGIALTQFEQCSALFGLVHCLSLHRQHQNRSDGRQTPVRLRRQILLHRRR